MCRRLQTILLVLLGSGAGLLGDGLAEGTTTRAVSFRMEEKEIGPCPKPSGFFWGSPDGAHFAIWGGERKKTHVILDGKPGPVFAEVSIPVFSPDGTRLAYVAEAEKEGSFIVADGQKGQKYDCIALGSDSRRPDWPKCLFSPDGKHLAYAAARGVKWMAVLDGKEGREYDSVDSLVFSEDGNHLAYRAGARGEWNRWEHFIVRDGKEGQRYEQRLRGITVGDPVFNADGTHLAYTLVQEDMETEKIRYHLILDEKAVASDDNMDDVRLSPDGKQFAYLKQEGGRDGRVHIVGNVLGIRTYDRIRKEPRYTANGGLTYVAERARKLEAVIDGKAVEIGAKFVLAPDGSRLAYLAEKEGKRIMVVDGKPGPAFENIYWESWSPPSFSRDGKHFAYGARNQYRFYMVVDDKVSRPYTLWHIYGMNFSRDGSQFAFIAAKHDDCSRSVGMVVIVNGEEGPPYEDILPVGPAILADGTVEYFGVRKGILYRVRHVSLGKEGK